MKVFNVKHQNKQTRHIYAKDAHEALKIYNAIHRPLWGSINVSIIPEETVLSEKGTAIQNKIIRLQEELLKVEADMKSLLSLEHFGPENSMCHLRKIYYVKDGNIFVTKE